LGIHSGRVIEQILRHTYEFLNVTNEMQILKTLLLSLIYMFRALLAHHQELKKTARAAYSDGML